MAGAELMRSGLTLKRWFWRGLFVLHFVSLGRVISHGAQTQAGWKRFTGHMFDTPCFRGSLVSVFAEEIRIKAKVGEIAVLPCCSKKHSTDSLNNYRVYWQKEDNNVVLAYAEGLLLTHDQKYVNRTEMDQNDLTLSIFPVELSDKDKYGCIIQWKESTKGYQKHCSMTVLLDVVVDYSKPVMSTDVQPSCGYSEVTVTCSSHGGYPSPRVSGVLNNESVEWRTEVSDTSPYNVTATLQLNVTDDSTLTCTIEYDNFEVSANYTLSKQKECPSSWTSPSHGVVVACLVLICIFLVAITLLLKYIWCRAREHVGCSHHRVPQDPAVVVEMKEGVRCDHCEVRLEAASD